MTEEPKLSLTHSFVFGGKQSTYTISFYSDYLAIAPLSGAAPEPIKYSSVYKIRSKGQRLRIIFRDGESLAVPCTISEMKKIKKLFKRSAEFSPSKIEAVVFIEFADAGFFLRIDSNQYDAFRASIIRRIARHLYPALNHEEISLELFRKFVFRLKKGSRLVEIENSEDLDAALLYFDYKIDVVIAYSDEG